MPAPILGSMHEPMPDEPQVAATIDALRARIEGSLLQHFDNAEAFVERKDLEAFDALAQMAQEERDNIRQLADLLDVLHATPGPRGVQMLAGGMHYNKPHVLLPLLIEDKKQLIVQAQASATKVAHYPRAADVVASITTRQSEHLQRLNALCQPSAVA